MLERFRRAIAPRDPDRGALPGLPWDAIYPPHKLSPFGNAQAYNAPRSIASSLSSQVLALANPARKTLVIYNASTANLYVTQGRVASIAGASFRLAAGDVVVLETPNTYQGDVAGVWDAVNGTAQVTESTY